jgi:hypothetical protein
MNTYATGDDITIEFSLLKNGSPLPDGLAGATVTAALRKTDRSDVAAGTGDVTATIVDATACTCTATWPRATTADIVPGKYLCEVQVTMSGQVRTCVGALVEIINGARPA